jgi:hypothetical protein
MNIFFLDNDPVIAAQMQCNKHATKMCLESAQMLSTAHRILDGDDAPDECYKIAHKNHPCTLWTMESSENYYWHYIHFHALCEEYTHRYGKIHASFSKLNHILENFPKNIKHGPMTKPALAMKDHPECMFENDPVQSYRAFYKTKQERFKMVWTNREIPEWFKNSDLT